MAFLRYYSHENETDVHMYVRMDGWPTGKNTVSRYGCPQHGMATVTKADRIFISAIKGSLI